MHAILKGLTLHWRKYAKWSEAWVHGRCAGCWAKFAEFEGPDILHEGYATDSEWKVAKATIGFAPIAFAI